MEQCRGKALLQGQHAAEHHARSGVSSSAVIPNAGACQCKPSSQSLLPDPLAPHWGPGAGPYLSSRAGDSDMARCNGLTNGRRVGGTLSAADRLQRRTANLNG
ncbi:unnamed protein product [Arctogadus glacialis]